jgi:hypothetical protein
MILPAADLPQDVCDGIARYKEAEARIAELTRMRQERDEAREVASVLYDAIIGKAKFNLYVAAVIAENILDWRKGERDA